MKTYAYFDRANHGIDFDAMLQAIDQIPSGDAILLHGCCHNPTGADPTPQQWEQIAQRVAKRKLLPILDFAYQGFADGLTEDAVGLRALCQEGQEMLVCSSFSKNFGLYCERVGAMTVLAKDSAAADVVQSQVKRTIRANYSNPPAHGGRIVKTILQDHSLTKQWQQELAQMRDRINGMRKLLVDKLAEHGVPGNFDFITNQRGMFSFSGLKPEQVDALREKHSIYIVGSGRINVAGITADNVDRLCSAIAEVVAG